MWYILKHTLANETVKICDKPWRLVKGADTIVTQMVIIIQRTKYSWHDTAHIAVQISGPDSQQNL